MSAREFGGRIVRAVWMLWAKDQPDIADHPGWLTPYDELEDRHQEVDRLISEAVLAVSLVKWEPIWGMEIMGVRKPGTKAEALAYRDKDGWKIFAADTDEVLARGTETDWWEVSVLVAQAMAEAGTIKLLHPQAGAEAK